MSFRITFLKQHMRSCPESHSRSCGSLYQAALPFSHPLNTLTSPFVYSLCCQKVSLHLVYVKQAPLGFQLMGSQSKWKPVLTEEAVRSLRGRAASDHQGGLIQLHRAKSEPKTWAAVSSTQVEHPLGWHGHRTEQEQKGGQ